jgi:hypothetical protein
MCEEYSRFYVFDKRLTACYTVTQRIFLHLPEFVMKKSMVVWFSACFISVIIVGIVAPPSAESMHAEPLLPIAGLMLGLTMGLQFGLSIPLVAFCLKKLQIATPYFACTFAAFSGLGTALGVLFGAWGFLLAGALYIIGELSVLCVWYRITCRWWQKDQIAP